MSFIYYVLIFLLYYAGPVYAGLEVEKEYEIVEEDDRLETEPFYAQVDVEVGELPSGKIKVFTDQTHNATIVIDKQDCDIMRKKDDTLAFGWKFGGLMWGFGPEIKGFCLKSIIFFNNLILFLNFKSCINRTGVIK